MGRRVEEWVGEWGEGVGEVGGVGGGREKDGKDGRVNRICGIFFFEAYVRVRSLTKRVSRRQACR